MEIGFHVWRGHTPVGRWLADRAPLSTHDSLTHDRGHIGPIMLQYKLIHICWYLYV